MEDIKKLTLIEEVNEEPISVGAEVIVLPSQSIDRFNVTQAAILTLKSNYEALQISGVEDKEGYKKVDAARKDVKKKRVEIEKTKKELNERAAEYIKTNNSDAKVYVELLKAIEDNCELKLQAIDNEKQRIALAEERKRLDEEQRIADIRTRRVKALTDAGCKYDGHMFSVGEIKIGDTNVKTMNDVEFANLFTRVEEAQKVVLAKIAEEERIRKEAEEKQEAQRKMITDRCGQLAQFGLRFTFENDCYCMDDINVSTVEMTVMDSEEWDALTTKISKEIEARKIAKEIEEAKLRKERDDLEREKALAKERQDKIDADNKIIADRQIAEANRIETEKKLLAQKKTQSRIDKLHALGMTSNSYQLTYKGLLDIKVESLSISEDEAFDAILNNATETINLLKAEEEKKRLQKIADEKEKSRLLGIQQEQERQRKIKEQEETEKKEQVRLAALAPDKEKLLAFAELIGKLEVPVVTTESAKKVADDVRVMIGKMQAHILTKTKSL